MPPLPFAIGAALSAIPSIFSGIKSIFQRKRAKNLKEDDFIPPALKNKLQRNRIRANATLFPGQEQAEEQIREAASGAIAQTKRASSSSSDLLNTIGAVDAQSKNAQRGLAQTNLEFRDQAQQDLGRTEEQVAAVEQRNRDDFNAAKSALKGASDQNMFNSLSGLATVGTALLPFNDAQGNPLLDLADADSDPDSVAKKKKKQTNPFREFSRLGAFNFANPN